VQRFGGRVPCSREVLKGLPGVGDYVASEVLLKVAVVGMVRVRTVVHVVATVAVVVYVAVVVVVTVAVVVTVTVVGVGVGVTSCFTVTQAVFKATSEPALRDSYGPGSLSYNSYLGYAGTYPGYVNHPS
jgi:hypothetical protein